MNMLFLQELFNNITQRDALLRRRQPETLTPDHQQLVKACHTLLESDGEASSIALASRALAIYQRLSEVEKISFFGCLTTDFAADPGPIDTAYSAYKEARDNPTLQRLFEACEPRRQELFRRLNLASDGTYELVKMREDLLGLLREHPQLSAIDDDFGHLFGSWFNRGFLMLKRIDWNTPASILEKIIRYEAVHEIQDWDDLRRRLDARDRRCFAFFHPAIGDEPLIFVEVALHKGLPSRIQPILSGEQSNTTKKGTDDSEDADTAAFFGISNCQTGLRGISFGNFLIKQVVQELSQELPQLQYFVTLSPVPGFSQWLQEQRDDEQLPKPLRKSLKMLETPDWHQDKASEERLKAVIRPLAARYLVDEKNRHGLPLNPVARFHLGNGAELHRINWLGDISNKGFKQAAGLMVNYLYVLDDIERNHENYTAKATVACSNEVHDLVRRARKLAKGETTK